MKTYTMMQSQEGQLQGSYISSITLSFHRVRESIDAGICRFHCLYSEHDPADILTKHWSYSCVWVLLKPLLFWKETLQAFRYSTLCYKEVIDGTMGYMYPKRPVVNLIILLHTIVKDIIDASHYTMLQCKWGGWTGKRILGYTPIFKLISVWQDFIWSRF